MTSMRSMSRTPMCGGHWPDAAASFLCMWSAMTVAMMLPVLLPALGAYRAALARAGVARWARLAASMAAGYFAVWIALGAAIFPLGVAVSAMAQRVPAAARAVPTAVGLVVLLAGMLQSSDWKMRQLAGCRTLPCGESGAPIAIAGAWKKGLKLGVRCMLCCAGLTAMLLAFGIMDPIAMAVTTAVIVLERLAPGGPRFARATGIAAVAAGAFMTAHAVAVVLR
jgi:predicted metal-binding membrane protein